MTTPTATAADATVAAVQDQASPLGLAWQVKLGTVNDGSDPASVTVQMDGDQAAVLVNATSMVGQLVPGERVYLIEVPPAGLYITGRMIGEERWLDGAIVDTTGSLGVTVGAAELDIPNFKVTVPAWQPSKVYMLEVQLSLTFSVATDTFGIRIRRDTALTGTLIAEQFAGSAVVDGSLFAWPLRPTSSERSVKLFLSVIRAAGTGTCTVNGPGTVGGVIVTRVWSGIRTADALAATKPGGIWRVT